MYRFPAKRRAPDHRWQEAAFMVGGKKLPRPETRVKEAVAVLATESPFKAWKPKRLQAAVAEAIGLHGADDPAERDTLDAWLLTGIGIAEVAVKTGLPADVVAAYAGLFFDVADRLAADEDRDDLGWQLFGDRMFWGIKETDVGDWKRYAALAGGPYILEPFLRYLAALPLLVPSDVSGLSDTELECLYERLSIRRWVLSFAPLDTAAQRLRMEFVHVLAEQQRFSRLRG